MTVSPFSALVPSQVHTVESMNMYSVKDMSIPHLFQFKGRLISSVGPRSTSLALHWKTYPRAGTIILRHREAPLENIIPFINAFVW